MPTRGYKGDAYHCDSIPDHGCSLAPSCLSCHLPYCKHDESPEARVYWGAVKGVARGALAATIVRLSAEGLVARQVGASVGLSERSVWRILQEQGGSRRPGRPRKVQEVSC